VERDAQNQQRDHENDGLTAGEYFSSTGGATSRLFRGSATGAITDLGTLGAYSTAGNGINSRGDIAGYTNTWDNTGNAVTYHAIRSINGGAIEDLNNLIDPAAGWVLEYAAGINDRGQITGYGTHNGATRAFRLTPNASPFPYGDANGDGTVSLPDAALLLRVATGFTPVPDLLAGDVAPAPLCTSRGFGDGRITVADAVRIVRYVKGLEPIWP
jgi:hypothetical protein